MAAPIQENGKFTLRFDPTGGRLPWIRNLNLTPIVITDVVGNSTVGGVKSLIAKHSRIPFGHLLLTGGGRTFNNIEVLTPDQVRGETFFFKIKSPNEIKKEQGLKKLASMETAIKDLDQQISGLQEQVSFLTAQRDHYSQQKEQLDKQLESLTKQIENIEGQIRGSKEREGRLAQQVSRLSQKQGNKKGKTEELARLQAQEGSNKERNNRLETRLSALQETREKLSAERELANQKSSEKEQSYLALQKQLGLLTGQRDHYSQRKEQLGKHLEELSGQNS